jgi:hypothetical protein
MARSGRLEVIQEDDVSLNYKINFPYLAILTYEPVYSTTATDSLGLGQNLLYITPMLPRRKECRWVKQHSNSLPNLITPMLRVEIGHGPGSIMSYL